jgi:hypothetical protein
MAAPRRRTSSHGNPERPNNNQTPLPVAHHHSGGFWRGRQRAPGARFLDRRATVWAKVPASITVVNDEGSTRSCAAAGCCRNPPRGVQAGSKAPDATIACRLSLLPLHRNALNCSPGSTPVSRSIHRLWRCHAERPPAGHGPAPRRLTSPKYRFCRALGQGFSKDAPQPCTRLARPAQNNSRSSRFTILPVPVLGSGVSRNSKVRGILNLAIRAARNSHSCSAVSA